MMEKACNGRNSESISVAVYEVTGEPAVVINGVPNKTPIHSIPIHLNDSADAEPNNDPHFGEWLEGRQVRKMFGDQYYFGKVVKYDNETNWYRVVYDDGDFEDLEWHELEEVLLPLDISLPLMTLASWRCKCEMSVSDSGIGIPKPRKCHVKNAESMEKGSVLLQESHKSELNGDKLIELEVYMDTEQTQESLKWQEDNEVQSKATLQKFECETSCCKLGESTDESEIHQRQDAENRKLLPTHHATELNGAIVQVNLNEEATEQETSKRQQEFQKESWRTARAEKQKRRDKSLVHVAVTEVKELFWDLGNC